MAGRRGHAFCWLYHALYCMQCTHSDIWQHTLSYQSVCVYAAGCSKSVIVLLWSTQTQAVCETWYWYMFASTTQKIITHYCWHSSLQYIAFQSLSFPLFDQFVATQHAQPILCTIPLWGTKAQKRNIKIQPTAIQTQTKSFQLCC